MSYRHITSTSYPLPECLTCPICFETYDCPDEGGNQEQQQQRIPVVTRCGHTFCRLCSIDFRDRCPICRSDFTLPLPNNFNFISLLKYWNANMNGRMVIDPDHPPRTEKILERLERLFQMAKEQLGRLFQMAKEQLGREFQREKGYVPHLTMREIWLSQKATERWFLLHVLLFSLRREYRDICFLIHGTIISPVVSFILYLLFALVSNFIYCLGEMFVCFAIGEYRQIWFSILDSTLYPLMSLFSHLLFTFVSFFHPFISSTLNFLGAMFATPLFIYPLLLGVFLELCRTVRNLKPIRSSF
jgi:hypothetical protein